MIIFWNFHHTINSPQDLSTRKKLEVTNFKKHPEMSSRKEIFSANFSKWLLFEECPITCVISFSSAHATKKALALIMVLHKNILPEEIRKKIKKKKTGQKLTRTDKRVKHCLLHSIFTAGGLTCWGSMRYSTWLSISRHTGPDQVHNLVDPQQGLPSAVIKRVFSNALLHRT